MLRLGHSRDVCLPGKGDTWVKGTPGLKVLRLGLSRYG